MKQVHAPPTDEERDSLEAAEEERLASGINRVAVRAWRVDGGWCSACRQKLVSVAHMGTENHNFALCGPCLKLLSDVLATGLENTRTFVRTRKRAS